MINWSKHKTIVFESDDWGQCYALPDAAALRLAGPLFPPSLAFSATATLERVEDLENLFGILERYAGSDGRKVIFQPNYIVANPDYEDARDGKFQFIDLPAFPRRWERGQLISKALEGIERGVWYPEYHGSVHYDYRKWLYSTRKRDPQALASLEHDSIALWAVLQRTEFDTEREYYDSISELNSHVTPRQQRIDIQRGADVFERLFGRRPVSVAAPAYCWQNKTERIFSENGIKVVQAKNRQNRPIQWPERILNRIRRTWGRPSRPVPAMGSTNSGVRYLWRNGDFEPVSSHGAKDALSQIQSAWSRNEPAIVSSHRVNFVNQSDAIREHGLREFDLLLGAVTRNHPEAVFLTDNEVGQLYSQSYSILKVGGRLRCRNYGSQTEKATVSIAKAERIAQSVQMPGNKTVDLKIARVESGIQFELPPGDYDLLLAEPT